METPEGTKLVKARPGRWLPEDHQIINDWIRRLKKAVAESPREVVPGADDEEIPHQGATTICHSA